MEAILEGKSRNDHSKLLKFQTASYAFRMKLRGNVFLISFALVIGQILTNTSPANSVEFGQDATGDPNAVHIQGNSSGFLYSERIIFTAAHVLNQLRIQPNGDTDGFVYAPGLADKSNAKRYKIIKAFIPKTFISPSNNPPQPLDDFAIIVLSEDMPLKTKVVIATEQQMIRFAQEKVKVQMVGYGLQSGSQRNDPQEIKRAPFKLSSYLYSPQMMQSFYTVSSKPPSGTQLNGGQYTRKPLVQFVMQILDQDSLCKKTTSDITSERLEMD